MTELLEELRASRDEMRQANAQLSSRLERVESALKVGKDDWRPSKERTLEA